MKLFDTKMMFVSKNRSVKVEVTSTNTLDMLKDVYLSNQASDYAMIQMFMHKDYEVVEEQRLSDEIRHTLNIVGTDNKITAIRLIRHLTKCSLLDAKNAVEGYSN